MRIVPAAMTDSYEDGSLALTVMVGTAVETTEPLRHMEPVELVMEPEEVEPKKGVSRKVRKASDREERKLAEDLGGRRQAGSGAMPWAKGDVRVRGKFRVEHKMTEAKSYRIEREVLDKIRIEAEGSEVPALVIMFSDGRNTDKWVMLPYEQWVKEAGDG